MSILIIAIVQRQGLLIVRTLTTALAVLAKPRPGKGRLGKTGLGFNRLTFPWQMAWWLRHRTPHTCLSPRPPRRSSSTPSPYWTPLWWCESLIWESRKCFPALPWRGQQGMQWPECGWQTWLEKDWEHSGEVQGESLHFIAVVHYQTWDGNCIVVLHWWGSSLASWGITRVNGLTELTSSNTVAYDSAVLLFILFKTEI